MKRMKWLAMLMAAMLALTAFATPALGENREIYSLEETLTALMDVYISTGEGHPTDDAVRNDYAASYLFYLANAFYGGEAKEVAELSDGNFDRFVEWDSAYVDGLLFRAFGPAFGVEDLGETSTVRMLNGNYYIAIGEGGYSRVAYAGEDFDQVDNTAEYPFSYTYSPVDGEVVTGEITVYLSVDPENGWAYVAAFSVDRDF